MKYFDYRFLNTVKAVHCQVLYFTIYLNFEIINILKNFLNFGEKKILIISKFVFFFGNFGKLIFLGELVGVFLTRILTNQLARILLDKK